MRSQLLTLSVLLSGVASADVNQHLADARKHLDEVDYPGAAAEVALARAELGNDAATSVEIRMLQGIIAAQQKKADAARDFFVEALTLAPEKRLVGSFGPRVKGPFADALKLVATQGPLSVSADAPQLAGERVAALKVRVEHDPLGMVLAVRFHFRSDGAPWAVKQVPAGPSVSASVDGDHFEWWAEALGEHDATLGLVGSAAHPLSAGESRSLVSLALPRSFTLTPVRTGALAVGGAAVVSLVVGIVFGSRAQSERAQFLNAPLDAVGLVSTMTQRDAFALDLKARTDSIVANCFFVGAAALAVAGALMWWLWGDVPATPAADAHPALTLRFP